MLTETLIQANDLLWTVTFSKVVLAVTDKFACSVHSTFVNE